MKKKIILSLFFLFLLFTMGSVMTMFYILRVTTRLDTLITLHQVEILRQDLVINVQTVQSHLYTLGTSFGKELDVIVENVATLDNAAQKCSGCHHSPEITSKIKTIQDLTEQYKEALSTFITTTAGRERVERLQIVAANIGNMILTKTQEMAFIANQKLNEKTIAAIKDVSSSRIILIVTLLLCFFIALAIAASLTREVTEPVSELLKATRKIKTGELGYTTSYAGKDEFKELLESFNDMSITLNENNKKIIQHLVRLSGLYRITLSFHAITNVEDIYKEVSYGIAELVEIEQCGVILLDKDKEFFTHRFPAFGLNQEQIANIRIPKENFIDIYRSSNRRPLTLNDNASALPFGEIDKNLNVKNLMLIWIRQKGELLGAIRVANKKSGDFSEEDSRILGILANNVSVALENAKLYENLKKQMAELKETQEELVQAAKLAAIGELASNIAHEINNPLTSILGYSELIKEETDINNIMRDIEVIEKESLRARDIVHQLLEFSRKRPLEIKEIQINDIMSEVLALAAVPLKDSNIKISKLYGDIPLIEGDANQLKQVFLNIINNAIFAMQGGGSLGVTTAMTDKDSVHIEIRDTGKGIPKEILQRIFEPFFTTKQEKGTGLGLSVSYKIIQSHNGRIDVESEEDRGTKFTIVLPVSVKQPF
ncbi:MAG: ATP-binding protein [Thermodesulfovibrionales bacterium]|nr:ATP-binding protein [Thermodesulfovibrionales bacterium]MDP3112441.1 ATP-binding protein [Thermodesulfovibrionales bacterium]